MTRSLLRGFKRILTALGAALPDRALHSLSMILNYMRLGRWMRSQGFDVPVRCPLRDGVFEVAARKVRDARVLYLEFGVYQGASMRWWSAALNNPGSRLHGFDSFEGLPEAFDDEYFRHMQWAHLASGAAGGGMRWPNRRPHVLTPGMRRAQRALADFVPLIEWTRFRRRCLNGAIAVRGADAACFGCADETQAALWVLRRDTLGPDGMMRRNVEPVPVALQVPGLAAGRYRAIAWDTLEGRPVWDGASEKGDSPSLVLQTPPIAADLAFAIRRQPA